MNAPLWGLLLKGLWITIQLTVYSGALAAFVSFAVGIARTHRLWIVRFLAGFYTEVFRGTSALVFMFWIFFVLPLMLGWQLVPMWAAVVSLGLTYGAYGSEVVRGALQSVNPAQLEAGIALSFTSGQRMRKVLIPQAWPEMIPPFNNLAIELLKGTALVSIMGVGDTAFSAQMIRLALQESTEVYTLSLVLYFIVAFVITRGMRGLERQAKAGIGQAPPKGPGLTRMLGLRQQSQTAAPKAGGGI